MPVPLVLPLPESVEVPATFPDPFEDTQCAVARLAAGCLMRQLEAGRIATGISVETLASPGEGKMFGVLVVRQPDGRLGYCQAFSGMLSGLWDVEGFVPPLFDRTARRSIEVPGEALLKRLLAEAEFLAPSVARDRQSHDTLEGELTRQRSDFVARHRASRTARHALRAEIAAAAASDAIKSDLLAALDQQSRGDKASLRRLDAAQDAARRASLGPFQRLDRRYRALERLRQMISKRLMREIHDTYWVPATCGERRLRDLFPGRAPPGGAGDCAAPKLLGYAHRQGLAPVALAEFWWGSSPATSARRTGDFYPPCSSKCRPMLEFMLSGMLRTRVSVSSPFGLTPPSVPVLYEDDWIFVVEKPPGLLSVPGRGPMMFDSVVTRVGASHLAPPLPVHRLDMDTSGLMVLAKDLRSQAELQRQFARREVHKRYIAWVDGSVASDGGRIELRMRGDFEDRPRQIHDPLNGREAVTDWHVLERASSKTRIAFFPKTGRTHQIRVHAAHRLGLAAPIVGDRLYGQPAERMLLHAEGIEFRHPRTGRSLSFRSQAPF